MAKEDRAKGSADDQGGDGDEPPRTLAIRAGRTLKDVDRLVNKSPEIPPQQKAMLQLEQAKASALFELANAIRESKSAGRPQQ